MVTSRITLGQVIVVIAATPEEIEYSHDDLAVTGELVTVERTMRYPERVIGSRITFWSNPEHPKTEVELRQRAVEVTGVLLKRTGLPNAVILCADIAAVITKPPV